MKGSLGSPGDPVGCYRTHAEALQALEGHQAGSTIVQVDSNGKPLASAYPPVAPKPVATKEDK
jgi:hypothetical protein